MGNLGWIILKKHWKAHVSVGLISNFRVMKSKCHEDLSKPMDPPRSSQISMRRDPSIGAPFCRELTSEEAGEQVSYKTTCWWLTYLPYAENNYYKYICQYTLIVKISWELQGKSKKYSTKCSLDKPAATGAYRWSSSRFYTERPFGKRSWWLFHMLPSGNLT